MNQEERIAGCHIYPLEERKKRKKELLDFRKQERSRISGEYLNHFRLLDLLLEISDSQQPEATLLLLREPAIFTGRLLHLLSL